jgi:uncharacterized protein YcbK (DUF882 family)
MTIDKIRRSVLVLGGLTGVLGGAAALGVGGVKERESDEAFWAAPRRLRLYRPQSGESVSDVYWQDGSLNTGGYLRICQLLRDIHVNQSVHMDVRLLDIIRAVQGYMEYYGFNNPIFINSGYRSSKTNANTEGAAKNSLHLLGRAVDFTMPGVPAVYMGALASHFQGGGVGFYVNSGFTHVDTGSVRYWSDEKETIRRP